MRVRRGEEPRLEGGRRAGTVDGRAGGGQAEIGTAGAGAQVAAAGPVREGSERSGWRLAHRGEDSMGATCSREPNVFSIRDNIIRGKAGYICVIQNGSHYLIWSAKTPQQIEVYFCVVAVLGSIHFSLRKKW